MKIENQIISFILFFIYGNIIYIINYLLNKYNKKLLIYPIILVMTISLIYLIYKVNGGIVHSYFIVILMLGIFISKVSVKYIKKKIIKLKKR